MKRKMTALLTVVLMFTMLAGCGNSSQTVTTGGTTSDSSSGISKETASSTGGTLSECLSTEKVIAYEVDTVDKSETPDNIYFFENGKVTVIPGKEFGLTMGDFAQMTDEEIWEKLEAVKTSYIENYVDADKEGQLKSKAIMEVINDPAWSSDRYDTFQEIYTALVNNEVTEEMEMEMIQSYLLYNNVEDTDAILEGFWGKTEVYTDVIAYWKNTIEEMTQIKESLSYKGPFFDLPFVFAVETDSSGNNAQSESLIYPTLKDSYDIENIDKFYDSLGFALGLTTEQQIYDTTYNCIALSGSGRFCTRETMETDTIDSKNVLVDLSKDEINELFREEVMVRYE
ncbi:MAG: hypothetical protein J6K53_17345 [Roseburia sp.]|nr:hypothetical protein [Roseburia sp.]